MISLGSCDWIFLTQILVFPTHMLSRTNHYYYSTKNSTSTVFLVAQWLLPELPGRLYNEPIQLYLGSGAALDP